MKKILLWALALCLTAPLCACARLASMIPKDPVQTPVEPIPGFAPYTDSEGSVRLQVPQDWTYVDAATIKDPAFLAQAQAYGLPMDMITDAAGQMVSWYDFAHATDKGVPYASLFVQNQPNARQNMLEAPGYPGEIQLAVESAMGSTSSDFSWILPPENRVLGSNVFIVYQYRYSLGDVWTTVCYQAVTIYDSRSYTFTFVNPDDPWEDRFTAGADQVLATIEFGAL